MNCSKNHIMCEGGTGIVDARSLIHMLCTTTLYGKGTSEAVSIAFETMDAGGEELIEVKKVLDMNKTLNLRNPNIQFVFLKLSDKVIKKKDGEQTLRAIAPEWYQKQTILTESELDFAIDKGYGRNLILGSLLSSTVLEAAMRTPEDKKAGFGAIIDEVVDSNGTYEVRVVFAGSGIGGEGRTNLCVHPILLRKYCIEAVMENLHLEYEQAKAYVGRVLKIAVIMTGAAFRFPRINGLDQDVAGLVSGTLRNYPAEAAEATDAFYWLEHDYMPVQASKASEGGSQFKHAHAIELVFTAAVENFFSRTDEELEKKGILIPHYSLPGNGKTNWANLGLPEKYRLALSARLRFDAMLFYWLRPQLDLTSEQIKNGMLYEAEIISRMYGGKTGRQLQTMVAYDELEEMVLRPFKILLERERLWLSWLRDICLTGMNWETGTLPGEEQKTDIFPVFQIDRMLNGENVSAFGGMTGFLLDNLSECGEGNLYHTRLTPDKARKLKYVENGNPRSFMAIMEELYDVCSSRKEKRTWLW